MQCELRQTPCISDARIVQRRCGTPPPRASLLDTLTVQVPSSGTCHLRKIDVSNLARHAHLCHDGNGAAGSASAVPGRANCPSGTLKIALSRYKGGWTGYSGLAHYAVGTGMRSLHLRFHGRSDVISPVSSFRRPRPWFYDSPKLSCMVAL